MLNKDQAVAVAEAIIAAERSALSDERDARASPIPFVYRDHALLQLPRREQARLLAQARRSAFTGWQPACLMASWLGAALLLLFFMREYQPGAATWMLLFVVAVAIGAQLRILLVRLRLQELLLSNLAPPVRE